MSSGVLCRLAFLLASLVRSSSSRPPPSFAFVSSSFVVVGMGVSLRGACGEIELTKNGAFQRSCHLRLIVLVFVLVLRGDGNRARPNGSETMDRCQSVRPLVLSYMPAGRFR